MKTKVFGVAVIVAAILLVAPFVAWAHGSQQKTTSTPHAPTMVIQVEDGSPGFVENFNPFSPTKLAGVDWIFEPLYIVNPLDGKKTPWLSTSYKWINTTTLRFTLRKGVKWNNGMPFTSKDVVFTFDLLKKHPALDLNSVWSHLKSVSASGNTVTFKFKTPDVPAWSFIATQTPIVQAKKWSKVKNPVKYTDNHPIGTGPFELGHFGPNAYTLKRYAGYWQASKVKVPAIESTPDHSNTTSDLQLSKGEFAHATLFTPNIKKTYVDKNPQYYHYWFPKEAPVTLRLNLTKYPFNNVAFRRALVFAINRQTIYKQGEYGYEPPANQSLLPPSLQKKWLDKSLQAKYDYHYDPKKAEQVLTAAGFKRNSQGLFLGKNGKPLTISLEIPNSYTDWIQSAEIVKRDLAKVGITVNVVTPSVSTDLNNMYVGTFDMAFFYENNYANPYYYYQRVLSSKESAPIGKVAVSNVERWNNKKTDRLLAEYARTTNPQKQHQIIDALQTIMYKDVPVVDLVYGAGWNEYQTNQYTGWPTKKKPYANPSNDYPDTLLIVTHLRPVK